MKKENHYFAWGLTAVCVVCAVLLIYDVVFRESIVMNYAGLLLGILAPILYGAAMAYLLAPIVNWFERIILRHQGRTPSKWRRAISVVLTWVLVLALLYGLLSILLPELYASVKQLFDNAQRYYNTIYAWVIHILENNPQFAAKASEIINEYYTDAIAWANANLVPQLQSAVQAVTGGVLGMFVFPKNLLLGIIISIYLLSGKESFAAGSSKLCYTILSED
ncbi:MAG: AI-2E family transporter, partial [Oscillospiraceae bacterium]|nr:AI-2E family transporter [Oscillospiraceae bacterium]